MAFDSRLHVRLPDEYGPDQLVQILAGKFPFVADPPVSEKWTFYDTFDWRLFDQSLVLRHTGRRIVLDTLSGAGPLDDLPANSAPEFAWDLPESSLRQRLEPFIAVRALLPLAAVNTRTSIYRVLNANEKTVARLVTTEARIQGPEYEPILATYLSLWPVRGYRKYARKLSKRLGRLPKVPSLIADLYLSALEQAGKKPGSYSSKLDLRLKPRERSDAATKTILRHLFQTMKANEAGIKADIDTEFLHDYRIAIRRTRSALSQIRYVFPTKETEHFKGSFRYLGQLTNELRDLDVYLLSEADFEALLPEEMQEDIVPLFDYLRVLREKALKEVIMSLSSPEYTQALEEWEVFLNKPLPKKDQGGQCGRSHHRPGPQEDL